MTVRLRPETSLLAIIDLQAGLIPHIDEADRVVARATFLARSARAIGVESLTSEQNPAKMGSTCEFLRPYGALTVPKMSFSAWQVPDWQKFVIDSGRNQIVICGLETHICVAQTALDMLEAGYEVVVCPDAVSASTLDRHKLGMERLRDAGIVPMHSEAVVYEWMRTSEHAAFREVLALVKEYR